MDKLINALASTKARYISSFGATWSFFSWFQVSDFKYTWIIIWFIFCALYFICLFCRWKSNGLSSKAKGQIDDSKSIAWYIWIYLLLVAATTACICFGGIELWKVISTISIYILVIGLVLLGILPETKKFDSIYGLL